ncbi:uncharacterized protein LOC124487125 isoform X1 [Hypomesus transpacificus]|uniref:uncharacterized protein LOC124487125 isoform X1 n=1 Tax=Hypomesus transpacificus TaxID=137520 RepID=UPI001F078154|nr:uncharacterized protein LOC124487125 isoform X1 [Hypomesus transpacificus]
MEDKGVCEESETSQPQNITPAAGQGPLVSVTFQTDPHRKLKYLESEPKALGVTQITFSVLKIFTCAVFYVFGLYLSLELIVIYLIGSVLGVVAGSLALAAQNLHLPTLKACLGMQVVACVVSILNLLMEGADLGLASNFSETCWMSWNDNSTGVEHDNCMMLSTTHAHYTAENLLIQAVSVAISVTLAAYCCKVINCCSPTSRMPVITVQAPSTLR